MFRRNSPPPLTGLSSRIKPEAQMHAGGNTTEGASRKSPEPTSPGGLSTTSFMSSFSWVAEASTTDVISMLRNAYSLLREKERDLVLAAEIGKSLVDNNISLKSKYEQLLHQLQQFERTNDTVVPDGLVMTPRDDDSQSEACLISHQRGREAMIEALERKNAEMQMLLDNAVAESEATDHAYAKRTRLLQREIDLLKSNLECATQKIQELQEDYNRRVATRRAAPGTAVDHDLLQELTEKMHKMQSENQDIHAAKRALEDKLAAALRDLDALHQQFDQFQFTQQGLDELKGAYQQQFRHIDELTQNLEEHRNTLARLRDRGVSWSSRSSPSPSEYGGLQAKASSSTLQDLCMTTPKQTLLRELENAWLKKLGSSTNTSVHDDQSFDNSIQSEPTVQPECDNPFGFALSDFASLTEHNLASFFSSPTGHAVDALLSSTEDDKAFVSEAVHLMESSNRSETDLFAPDGTGSAYEAYNLYPQAPTNMCSLMVRDIYTSATMWGIDIDIQYTPSNKGIAQRVFQILRYVFRLVWRWCRVAVILAAAFLINMGDGPEAIMEK